jgi:hypothetical protein
LAEFTAGRAADAATRARILASQREAFAEDAAGQAEARRQVAAFLGQVDAASRDPVATAALREHARATIRFDWAEGPGAAVRREVALLDPVLAEDARERIVVTRSCLEWLLRSNGWVAELLGLPAPVTGIEGLEGAVRRDFAGLDPGARAALASAERRHMAMQVVWAQTDPAGRARLIEAGRRAVPARRTVPDLARALEVAALAGKLPEGTMEDIGARLGVLSGLRGALYGFRP